MKKLPRRTRDPCRRSERTAKPRRASSRPVKIYFLFRNKRAPHSLRERRKRVRGSSRPTTLYLLQLRRRPDRSISHRRMTAGCEYEAGRRVKRGKIGFFRSLVKTSLPENSSPRSIMRSVSKSSFTIDPLGSMPVTNHQTVAWIG